MNLVLLPDAVRLVNDWLRAQPELAALVGERVYSIIPGERTYPLVLCAQVGDAPLRAEPRYWWATRVNFRVSSYASTANEARTVIETVRALLVQRATGAHALGVIAYVTLGNLAFLPDDSVLTAAGRPIPRWTCLITVTVHPNP